MGRWIAGAVAVGAPRYPDAEVRVSAAEALSRASGGRVCRDPGEFRGACDDGAAKAVDAWVETVRAPGPPPKQPARE